MNIYRCKCDISPKYFFIEADYGADPIWCAKCKYNLDIDDFPISNELKSKFNKWLANFNNWINDEIEEKNLQIQKFILEHNKTGNKLAIELMEELGKGFDVSFKPLKTTSVF